MSVMNHPSSPRNYPSKTIPNGLYGTYRPNQNTTSQIKIGSKPTKTRRSLPLEACPLDRSALFRPVPRLAVWHPASGRMALGLAPEVCAGPAEERTNRQGEEEQQDTRQHLAGHAVSTICTAKARPVSRETAGAQNIGQPQAAETLCSRRMGC